MPLRERKYAPAGFFYEAINLTLPGEYALSLKRERWRAARRKGCDLPMGLRFARNDAFKNKLL